MHNQEIELRVFTYDLYTVLHGKRVDFEIFLDFGP